MRSTLALCLALAACDGLVGEPGDYGPADAVVRHPQAPRVLAFTCDASAVTASAPVQCLVQATHPGGLPMRCALDPGDGQAIIELGDCAVPLSATVRFRTPGHATMRLVVTDDAGRSSTRTVAIEVTGVPNRPPAIWALTATPARGGAPLRTRLTFTASDPESDAMTCRLDVNGDGSIDDPVVDCAAGSQDVVLTVAGAITLRLAACDALEACSDASVTVTVLQPVGDVRISQVDWGQSVVGRNLRLVEGKPALLRVSALADAASVAGVVVEAEVTKAGSSLGRLTLQGPAAPPTAETLADLTKQYRTILPKEWVSPGIEVTVRVDPGDVVPETDETNNTAVLRPAVGRGNVLHLTAVPVIQGGLTGTAPDVTSAVTRVWPFKSVEARTRAPYTFSRALSGYDVNAWGELLGDLAQVRAADGSRRNYYGFPRVGYGAGVAGIGLLGQSVATGRDDSLSTVVHELGHNFGRPHAPCGGAASPDPQYPYAGGRIGSWGWDGQRLINPASAVDLMSYCSPEWVSDYNYGRVQQFAESASSMSEGAVLPRLAAYLVAGRVKGEVVQLSPVYRVVAHPTAPAALDAPLTLRLVTSRGVERIVPVEAWEAEDDPSLHFVAVIEDLGELAALQLLRGSRPIFERVATPTGEPDISVTRVGADAVRVKWNAAVYPYAALAHLDDVTRTTLALKLTGGDVVVHTGPRAPGAFEVSVSDGLTSARAVVTPDG